jgi:hypothetical protein
MINKIGWLTLIIMVSITGIIFAGTTQLPQTGQTTCYDSAGTAIPCAGTGQDGDLRVGIVWPNPRFAIIYCNSTGPCSDQGSDCDGDALTDIIKDNLTGLIWSRDVNLPAVSQDAGARTWQQSLDYIKVLNLCGYTDWHMPTIVELESLVTEAQDNSADWLTTQGFTNWPVNFTSNNTYWSSTTRIGYLNDYGSAWIIRIKNGDVTNSTKTRSNYLWPVRSGQ